MEPAKHPEQPAEGEVPRAKLAPAKTRRTTTKSTATAQNWKRDAGWQECVWTEETKTAAKIGKWKTRTARDCGPVVEKKS